MIEDDEDYPVKANRKLRGLNRYEHMAVMLTDPDLNPGMTSVNQISYMANQLRTIIENERDRITSLAYRTLPNTEEVKHFTRLLSERSDLDEFAAESSGPLVKIDVTDITEQDLPGLSDFVETQDV